MQKVVLSDFEIHLMSLSKHSPKPLINYVWLGKYFSDFAFW